MRHAFSWQQEPMADWGSWVITGPRGAGKSWALRNLLVSRAALDGDRCAFVPHPSTTRGNELAELAIVAADDFGLDSVEDFQLSLFAGVISFRSGGSIEVMKGLEHGQELDATTLAVDQPAEGARFVPFFRQLERYAETQFTEGSPSSSFTIRDAT